MSPAAPGKRRAWRLGHVAEAVCACYLRLKGYRILARRLRNRGGEIDIVARRRRTLVFVEVKARADLDQAAHAITAGQRRTIERAAEAFLAGHPGLGGLDVRFDAMLVRPWRAPCHIADAWRPE